MSRDHLTLVHSADAKLPPPHDLDAEASVLSAVLVDATRLPLVRTLLEPDDFYSRAHVEIFRAVVAVAKDPGVLDPVLVAAWLRDRVRLVDAGGMAYLTEVLGAAPCLDEKNVRAYAERVRDLANRRRLIATCQRIAANGYLGMPATSELAASLRTASASATENSALPVHLLSTQDLATPLGPVPYLVPGLGLAPGPVALVAGYGNSRKTLALQDLALAVATGTSTWGTYACRRGRVLHLDYEQGRHLTQARYQRLARARGIALGDLAPDALRVACMPSVYLDASNAEDVFARLFENTALVIVDSLRAAAPSADENSSEVRRPLDTLTRVAERTGTTVILIHHARKPSKDDPAGAKFAIRGSSALFDACSSVFVFEGVTGEPTRVHHEKDRHRGTTLASFGLTSVDVDIGGDPRGGLRVMHLEDEQVAQATRSRGPAPDERLRALQVRVLDVVRANPGASKRLVRELTDGVRGQTVDVALEALVKAGRVRVEKTAHGGAFHAL